MQREAGWEDALSNTFIEDQAYWRKWWSALFQPKANRKRNGFLLLAFGWIAFAYLLLLAVFEKLKIVEPDGVMSYEDARSFFLMLAALLSPFLAFLGFHIADRRLHEQEKQTNLQTAAAVQQRYVDSVKLLSGKENHQKFSGITALRDPDIARNDTLFNAASSTLLSFIRTYGRPLARNQDTATDKDRVKMVQEAFNTWCFLEAEHETAAASDANLKQRQRREIFEDLRLPRIRFDRGLPIRLLKFDNCNLNEMECFGPELQFVAFHNCSLIGAQFFTSNLVGCEFTGNIIDSANFQNMISDNKVSILSGSPKLETLNLYSAETPPILQEGMHLNTPVKEDNEFMTAGEARQALNHEYDIQGPDDKVPKFIIYRGPDDRPENIRD